jgi:hypothetical protein
MTKVFLGVLIGYNSHFGFKLGKYLGEGMSHKGTRSPRAVSFCIDPVYLCKRNRTYCVLRVPQPTIKPTKTALF